MKFKSSGLPALEVLASSGFPCQFFERKERGEAHVGPRNK
jgi:hypothetical protein